MNIKDLTKQLQLTYIGQNFEMLVEEAKNTKMTHADFIVDALSKEIELRRENRIERKLRQAKFPFKKYLQDLDLLQYKKEVQNEIDELMTLDFVDKKENVILIANSGRGKTHLGIGLGIAAALNDKRVLFTNIPNLVIELKEAMSRNEVTAYKNKFEKYELVIIDELGYISFDKEGSDILFNLISNRITAGSMIITTNLAFDEWISVFKDPHLTGALVDRIARQAHILNMSGDSYRLQETKTWLQMKHDGKEMKHI